MADTMFDINNPQARKHYGARMFEDSITASYFGNNLMGRSKWPEWPEWPEWPQTPVQLLIKLGEQIPYDLYAPLQGQGAYGDDKPEPESPDEYRDTIYIGQVRRVYSDGRMTSLQQVQNLREEACKSLVDGFGRLDDQLFMLALSGRRGAVNADRLEPDILGVCEKNKVFKEPDPAHIFYGGDAASLDKLKESDTLTLDKIEAICTQAGVLGGDEGVVPLRPLEVNGGEYYVLLMHPDSVEDLRKSTDPRRWKSIQDEAQKAQREAEAVGSKSPIFKKAFGLIGIGKQVLLHQHELVPRFNDGGEAKNIEWSRAFFLGRQALIWAFGGAQPGCRFDWWEETSDHGNQTWVAAYTWLGVKRTTFKGKALGMIAVDHALSKKPAGV